MIMEEKKVQTADALWAELGALHKKSNSERELIYRGHSDSKWDLLPSLFRIETKEQLFDLIGTRWRSEQLTWFEFTNLRNFIYCCDDAGSIIPTDSVRFRRTNLMDESFSKYRPHPENWPDEELIDSMALAQLHGLPTRLLDWTTNPYVAAYFAASHALNYSKWYSGRKIAIFILEKGAHLNQSCGPVRILRVGGSVSKNVVAQQGLFTVHPTLEKQGEIVEIMSLENYLPSQHSIIQLTLPVEESLELYQLCVQFGFNAARLFPTADGACRAVIEHQSYLTTTIRIAEADKFSMNRSHP